MCENQVVGKSLCVQSTIGSTMLLELKKKKRKGDGGPRKDLRLQSGEKRGRQEPMKGFEHQPELDSQVPKKGL